MQFAYHLKETKKFLITSVKGQEYIAISITQQVGYGFFSSGLSF